MTKIFIASPTKWGINPYTHASAFYNAFELGRETDIDIFGPRFYDDSPLSEARNIAVAEFLKTDCDYILMVDDDHVYFSKTLPHLVLSAEESEEKVVSAWYQARKGTGTVVLFKRIGEKKLADPNDFSEYKPYSVRELVSLPPIKTKYGNLVYVDGIGAGCLLIRRDVFDEMEYPYFAEWHPLLNREEHHFGEDLWFSDKCAELGIKIAVNLKCFIGHWAKQGFVMGWQHLQRKALDEGIVTPEQLLE